ncbi:MAG: carboxypeptidase regulatory-like domain-containing protein [Gemmatimonadales bacterium]
MRKSVTVVLFPLAVVMHLAAPMLARAQGDLEGRVFATDSGRRALAGAHVQFPAVNRAATADSTGRFAITDIPAGRHLVVVGKLGFRPESAFVMIPEGQVLVQEFVLRRPVTELAEVKVVGAASHPEMSGFDDRRREGIGKFIDRASLAKIENRTTSMVLSSLGGLRVWQGGTQAYVSSTRAISSKSCGFCSGGIGEYLRPEDIEAGARPACYMDVYVDGVQVYQYGVNPPMPLFNVNSLPPEQIEGIEAYSSASQVPVRFNKTGSGCGVLVIWTRR